MRFYFFLILHPFGGMSTIRGRDAMWRAEGGVSGASQAVAVGLGTDADVGRSTPAVSEYDQGAKGIQRVGCWKTGLKPCGHLLKNPVQQQSLSKGV